MITELSKGKKRSLVYTIVCFKFNCQPTSQLFAPWLKFYSLEDECGPDVEDRHSNIVNSGIRQLPNEAAVDKTKGKYKQPANCYNLCTPKFNEPIWDQMRKETRWKDISISKIQSTLLKALMLSVLMISRIQHFSTTSIKCSVAGVRIG